MALFTYGWVRVEGPYIPDKTSLYGPFVNIPPSYNVFYNAPEIQIYNKNQNPIFALTNGIVYRVVPLSDFGGFTDIIDIDSNWPSIEIAINSSDKTVDTTNGKDYYWNEPFVVDQSSVIFYAESTEREYKQYAIILVDNYYSPEMLMITAKYTGSPIPVDDSFDEKDLQVNGIMSDGNSVLIKTGYTIDPPDCIIRTVGSNPVKITYIDQAGKKFEASCIVLGVKKLIGISGTYDGPVVAFGKEADRKYFVVVANYSDGTSSTITDFSFPNGNVVSESNNGVIDIFYKGFYSGVVIPTYEVSTSRLIAYYSGPAVEIGNKWNTEYAKIKIYYSDDDGLNSYYEDIDPSVCTFSTTNVEHEGICQVKVSYTGKTGTIHTNMLVIGFKPEVKANFIEANYTGPEVYLGKTYSLEKVIVKVHYSNGQIIQVKGFSTNSNIINFIGLNEYICTYSDRSGNTLSTTFSVIGIPPEETFESNYSPISLLNNYPEMTIINNRYRGPLESHKHDHIAIMLYDNIMRLNGIFKNIEHNYNQVVNSINSNTAIKYWTLDNIKKIETEIDKWLYDDRFTTGEYKKPEDLDNE